MPIITPAYPHHNSTFNVFEGTKDAMTQELLRARDLLPRIALGQCPWEELWAPRDFFASYRRFIKITAHANAPVRRRPPLPLARVPPGFFCGLF